MVKFTFKPKPTCSWTKINVQKNRVVDENMPEIHQRPQFMAPVTIDWHYLYTCPVCSENAWKLFDLLAEYPLTLSANFRCSSIPKAILQSNGWVKVGGFDEGFIRFTKDETFDLTAAIRQKKILQTEDFPLTAIKVSEDEIPPKIHLIPGYDKKHGGTIWESWLRGEIDRRMGISNFEKTLKLHQKLFELKEEIKSKNKIK